MTQSKQRTPLSINALLKKLQRRGATLDETTIQKWARKGIIPPSIPQQRDKGQVGHYKKAGDKGGRPALYPPEAFEDAAAAWCVVEAARNRRERIPTVGTLRKTVVYSKRVLNALVTDFRLATTLRRWDYVSEGQALPNHLADNIVAKGFLGSSTRSSDEKGLVDATVLLSADYHPYIVSYICGWAKSFDDYDLRIPIIASVVWQTPETPDKIEFIVEPSIFDCDCLSLINIQGRYGFASCATTPSRLVTSAMAENDKGGIPVYFSLEQTTGLSKAGMRGLPSEPPN
ncbi:MAG: hypothetical protein ABSE80_07715 [Halobacteriota archaeon]|jgi:hypothetical protein